MYDRTTKRNGIAISLAGRPAGPEEDPAVLLRPAGAALPHGQEPASHQVAITIGRPARHPGAQALGALRDGGSHNVSDTANWNNPGKVA